MYPCTVGDPNRTEAIPGSSWLPFAEVAISLGFTHDAGLLFLLKYMTYHEGYPLHTAVCSNVQRKEKLQYLLSKLPPVEQLQRQCSWNGYNALHIAASTGAADVIRLLVEAGFDVNMQSVLLLAEELLQAKVRYACLHCGAAWLAVRPV